VTAALSTYYIWQALLLQYFISWTFLLHSGAFVGPGMFKCNFCSFVSSSGWQQTWNTQGFLFCFFFVFVATLFISERLSCIVDAAVMLLVAAAGERETLR